MRPLYIIGRTLGDRGSFITSLILQLHRQVNECVMYNDLANAHDYVYAYFNEHTNHRMIAKPVESEHQNEINFTGKSNDPMIIINQIWQYKGIDFNIRKAQYDNIKYVLIESRSDEMEELVANDFYKATAPYSEFRPSIGNDMMDRYRKIAQTNPNCRPNLSKLTELNLIEQQTIIRHWAAELALYQDRKTKECLSNVPCDIPIYKIKFKDIVENKELVLSTLETVTGFKRTQAISDSYDIYLEKQKILYQTKMSWIHPK